MTIKKSKKKRKSIWQQAKKNISEIIFFTFFSFIFFICIVLIINSLRRTNQYYEKSVFELPKTYKLKKISKPEAIKIKIPILMYHYVEFVKDIDSPIKKSLNITPYTVEKQLQTLKEASYEAVFIKDIAYALDNKIKLPQKPIALTFDDGYQDFYSNVFPLLKKYQIKATAYIIINFLGRENFLSKKEVRELSESGLVEIAAHTLDHVNLKSVNEKVAEEEISLSKSKLEEIINTHVFDFAYPYGAFNHRAETLVKKASYLTSVSVIPGIEANGDNRFFLSRLRPGVRTGKALISWLEEWDKPPKSRQSP